MHKIRAAARHGAWSEGNNPFGRTTSRTSRKSDVDRAERGFAGRQAQSGRPASTHSENCATDIEQSVQPIATDGPKRSETMPSEPSSTISQHPPVASFHQNTNSASEKDSMVPLNNSIAQTNQSDGPRQRKKDLGAFSFKAFGKRGHEEEDEDEKKKNDKFNRHIPWQQQLRAVVYPQWLTINWLLILVPVGIAAGNVSSFPAIAVFVINFIAIVPLAGILAYATEEIAMRIGETLGGLLNASFGNAVELIVGIIALVKHEIVIVQASLIGSMLSNLLLVMGMCFFFGGLNRIEQNFNVTVAQTSASLLALSIGCLIIPTAFTWGIGGTKTDKDEQISRGTAIIMLVVYISYLLFQLKTHRVVFNAPSEKVEKRKKLKKDQGESIAALATLGAGQAAHAGGGINKESLLRRGSNDSDDDDEETPQLSLIGALITLAGSTALVGICAEYLVDSITAVTEQYNISQYFVGLILLPIVGNAAEHATAVTVAIKDKMDLAIGVAVGSSIQIALLVLPLMVILAWILGGEAHNRDMTLVFDDFQIAVIFIAVILVNYLISDGKSHWLEGVLLMSLYVIIATASWFYPTNADTKSEQ